MTTKTDGGHAFPTQSWEYDGQNQVLQYQEHGMSLRDWFAGKICAAMMTTTSADSDYPNLDYQRAPNGPTVAQRIACISYQMADAMLAAREKQS